MRSVGGFEPYAVLAGEARALLSRVRRVKPFALLVPSVSAAALSPGAQAAVERHVAEVQEEVQKGVRKYLSWLDSREEGARPAEAQRRLANLRILFNAMLVQVDIFADALVQRCEHENGVWLKGLDVAAADALSLPDGYFQSPPVICYLDRGRGGAIRRARTRLPGGGTSPVAIVRIPRERMVGSGIAASLVHEVGHQAAALLGLVNSLRPTLLGLQRSGRDRLAWVCWERWISEIIPDFWAVAKVGMAATLGLVAVVSLPRSFVFRIALDDPHPFPWIRVKLSCALGNALYPHPQWARFAQLWEALYPRAGLDTRTAGIIRLLEETMSGFVALLAEHRPRSLRGRSLSEVLASEERHPAHLTEAFPAYQAAPERLRALRPTRAFALIGQARADEAISPEAENRIIGDLLTHWAVKNSLETSETCAQHRSGVALAA